MINDIATVMIEAINGYSVITNTNNMTIIGIINAINNLTNLFSIVLIVCVSFLVSAHRLQ